MKILFLSRWFPYPANNGSKLRIFNLLSGLSSCHEVTLLSFADPSEARPDAGVLQEICKECYTVLWREFDPKSRQARIGFLSSRPRFLVDTYSVEMETEIRRLVSKTEYDLVIASQLTMASYCDAFGNVPAFFEEVELGSFHEHAHSTKNRLMRLRNSLTWFKLRAYFSRILKSFAACTVVSEKERIIFSKTFPEHEGKAFILPNCIDLKQYHTAKIERKPHHIIFSGSFRYTANYHAMLWFLHEVYPLILEHVPDTQLIITGDHADLPLPMTRNIHRTGHVEDIKSLIASCDVSIVPIWSGGGTRLKILEAMAVGTPVVATTKGAEGLLAENGQQLLIADQPEAFARHVIRIIQDDDFSRQLASSARRLVQEQYDWNKVMPSFLQLVEKVMNRQY